MYIILGNSYLGGSAIERQREMLENFTVFGE